MQLSKKSGLTHKKPVYLFLSHVVSLIFFLLEARLINLFSRLLSKSTLRLNVFFFSSLKIVDSKEQDVAFSIVAQKREDTQTMSVVLKGELPPYGECITLSYFVQALKCVKQHL